MSQQRLIHPVAGVYLGATQAKIKKADKTDLSWCLFLLKGAARQRPLRKTLSVPRR